MLSFTSLSVPLNDALRELPYEEVDSFCLSWMFDVSLDAEDHIHFIIMSAGGNV